MTDKPLAIVQIRNELELKYAENAKLRALLQLIPGFSVVDTYLTDHVERIKVERTRTFFDELARDEIHLSDDLIESEDFLHCYFSTYNAALRTRRRDKIRLFAQLLKSSISQRTLRDIDEFEEFCAILHELSYTEWQALLILDEHGASTPKNENENLLQWSLKFWDHFKADLTNRLGIAEAEVTPFMNRLSRTGLYDQFVGNYLSYTGGVGCLTKRFRRFKELLQINAV